MVKEKLQSIAKEVHMATIYVESVDKPGDSRIWGLKLEPSTSQ
jgi:hypothetical protein